MANGLRINYHGQKWLEALEPAPDWQPSYESEKWKWATMYNRSFEDWEKIRNMGLVREYPQVTALAGLAVEYDKLPANPYTSTNP
jgi:hypothetical protein